MLYSDLKQFFKLFTFSFIVFKLSESPLIFSPIFGPNIITTITTTTTTINQIFILFLIRVFPKVLEKFFSNDLNWFLFSVLIKILEKFRSKFFFKFWKSSSSSFGKVLLQVLEKSSVQK